MSSVRILLGTV